MILYVDTSALFKTVLTEAESPAVLSTPRPLSRR